MSLIYCVNNQMFRFISLFVPIFTLLSVSLLYSQISNPTGNLNPTADDDIWVQTLTGSHFNEFWNYQFYLNDDMTIHITFSVANFGSLKSAVSGVQVSVQNLNGKLYQLSREYDIEHLVQDREKYMFRNRMEREIFFEGKLPNDHRVRIQTTKDDITYDIDLRLFNIEPGFKWGDGKYRIGNDEVGIITHIPYAQVRGTVAVDGVRKRVNGSAYMDHTYQNRTTTQLMDSGFRYVNHMGPKNWDIIYLMLPKRSEDRKTIGYRVQNNNGTLNLQGVHRISSIEKNYVFGENVAHMIELNFNNGQNIQLLRTENHEKFSVLSELGRVARSVARRFLGGEVIHFRGEATLLEPAKRRKDGYYNFFIIQ